MPRTPAVTALILRNLDLSAEELLALYNRRPSRSLERQIAAVRRERAEVAQGIG